MRIARHRCKRQVGRSTDSKTLETACSEKTQPNRKWLDEFNLGCLKLRILGRVNLFNQLRQILGMES